jgi:chorismate mutase
VTDQDGWKGIPVCRGVRGATTTAENTRECIIEATKELLAEMIDANGIDARDVGSAIFTTTVDLNAEYPALAARMLGWMDVPLLCGHEMDVPGGLKQVVRVLIHWNTVTPQKDIQHIYINGAEVLRPDQALKSSRFTNEEER